MKVSRIPSRPQSFLVSFVAVTMIVLSACGSALAHGNGGEIGEGNGVLGSGDTYVAVLNSGQVASDPLCPSSAIGNVLFTYKEKSKKLCYAVSYSGLLGHVHSYPLGVHLHAPAHAGDNVKPHLFALDADGSGSPLTGCVSLTKRQAKWLRKGLFYIQVHTGFCTFGELRGQILRTR